MANRPIPDSDLARRAHELQRMGESEMHRHLREEWEAAIGSARVSTDALRTIWPVDADHLPPGVAGVIERAHDLAESLYATLDTVSVEMGGELMHMVQTFHPEAVEEVERAEHTRGIPHPDEEASHGG